MPHRFTGEAGKNKSYPLRTILETISTFNLGHSLTETQQAIRNRFHLQIPERTISSWLTEYRPLTTYSRLRAEGKKLFSADAVIRTILRAPAGLFFPLAGVYPRKAANTRIS